MEGRTIARPNPQGHQDSPGGHQASMEGRTIARPNLAAARDARDDIIASMEGRTIARPNYPRPPKETTITKASMEGRTIARPNRGRRGRPRRRRRRFNGGPDNCPAKLGRRERRRVHRLAASMEGRTIARPNAAEADLFIGDSTELQWRAGQLPGQTKISSSRPPAPRCFNGGPDNCPAKRPADPHDPDRRGDASMEGRTIARPNFSINWQGGPDDATLQWRAGQLPGQTTTGQACATPPPRASMEGRTIARPNVGDARLFLGYQLRLQWRAGQLPGQTWRQG